MDDGIHDFTHPDWQSVSAGKRARGSFQGADEKVLIVVPALNEAKHIERVVETLLDGAPENARLIVADGGSEDATAAKVRALSRREPRIQLIENPERFQSAGINRAVELGHEADVLIRADAHALYPPSFCSDLLRERHASGADAVAVRMITRGSGGFHAGVAAAQNSALGTGGSAHRTGSGGRYVDHGHHALIDLRSFRRIGGYDPSQPHNEDAEFDHRLRQAGGQIWLAATTSIGYIPRRSPVALFRQYFNYGYGRATTILKHRLVPRFRQVLPLATIPAIVLAVVGTLATLVGAPATALLLLPLAAWMGICLAYGSFLAANAREPDVLWAGPAAMIMHAAWAAGFFVRVLHRILRD